MKRDILDRLLAARTGKRPAVLVTEMPTGLQTVLVGDVAHGAVRLGEDAVAAARAALAADRSGMAETAQGRVFLHVFNPPLRLIVVGAVHIAQPLAPIAALAGYDVTIVDPRRAFATDERFPSVAVDDAWPDEALAKLGPDARTAVVTLTHDPKLDDPALGEALRSPAFYIGALGSRRTHAKRLDRLRAQGFAEGELARIHGPVGLAIGALSPAEIALSIMADITATLRAGRQPAERAA